jgi:hypothetical protein
MLFSVLLLSKMLKIGYIFNIPHRINMIVKKDTIIRAINKYNVMLYSIELLYKFMKINK